MTILLINKAEVEDLKMCIDHINNLHYDRLYILDVENKHNLQKLLASMNNDKIELVNYDIDKNLPQNINYTISNFGENKIILIMQSDVILLENSISNMLNHIEIGKVINMQMISSSRNFPNRIIKKLGHSHDSFDDEEFQNFGKSISDASKNETDDIIDFPILIYTNDFNSIGGYDEMLNCSYCMNVDLMLRLKSKYNTIRCKDAIGYSILTDEMEDDKVKYDFVRKWGRWIDINSIQQINNFPVFNKTLSIMYWDEKSLMENDMLYKFLTKVEPWFNNIEIHSDFNDIIDRYIYEFQQNTKFNLKDKFYSNHTNGFIVQVNINNFGVSDYNSLSEISNIISNIKELGIYELGNITIELENIPIDRSKELIVVNKDKK